MSITKLVNFLKENRGHLISASDSTYTATENLSKADDEKKKPSLRPRNENKESKRKWTKWAARGDYTEVQSKEIRSFMEEGYSPREAERMANAHGQKNLDYEKAMAGNTSPDIPSEKMRGEMQNLADHWLGAADKYERRTADKSVNPHKHAAGVMEQAQEAATGDYTKAYNEFLGSDDLKDKKGRERHKAVRAWKKQYKEDNPEHEKGLDNLADTQKTFEEADQARETSVTDILHNILHGNKAAVTEDTTQSEPDPDAAPMSDAESEFKDAQALAPQTVGTAKQLAGGTSQGGADSGDTGTLDAHTPEEVSFANKNQKLIGMLSDEQKERHTRNAGAKAAQDQQQEQQAPKPEFKPKVVRRRKPGGE